MNCWISAMTEVLQRSRRSSRRRSALWAHVPGATDCFNGVGAHHAEGAGKVVDMASFGESKSSFNGVGAHHAEGVEMRSAPSRPQRRFNGVGAHHAEGVEAGWDD